MMAMLGAVLSHGGTGAGGVKRWSGMASMAVCLSGMEKESLGIIRVLMEERMAMALFGVVVVSTAGLARIMWISDMKMSQQYDNSGGF
jgi:hypothetical protein